VRPADLDPLDHVNNAVYLDWLEEALDAAGWTAATSATPRSIRLEYQASAERGDAVSIDLHGGAEAWTAVIRRADAAELVRATGTSRA
jgi:acyl-ACP thioesterase